jgi:hypothetical protein
MHLIARRSNRKPQPRALWFVLLVGLCLLSTDARPRETVISDVRTLLVDGVYRLGARVDIDFNETLPEALHNGVPLLIELRIEVLRKRQWYWIWPELVADLRQRFKLEYHVLSRRYLVYNYSSGVQQTFRSMDGALQYIGNVYDLPLIDAQLLDPEQHYLVRIRAGIDVEALPTPVRLWAYLGSEWSLKSRWFEWPLKQ